MLLKATHFEFTDLSALTRLYGDYSALEITKLLIKYLQFYC